MHEVGIMQSALDLAQREARQKGATAIHRLRLRVGTMSGVVPDALTFAFQALAPGTLAEGATLEVESIIAAMWCDTCQAEFECPDLLPDCPRCGHPGARLVRGRELELASLEVTCPNPNPEEEPHV